MPGWAEAPRGGPIEKSSCGQVELLRFAKGHQPLITFLLGEVSFRAALPDLVEISIAHLLRA